MYGWCPQELSRSTYEKISFLFVSVIFEFREFVINETELETFTIFLKTMVTFTEFKKNL